MLSTNDTMSSLQDSIVSHTGKCLPIIGCTTACRKILSLHIVRSRSSLKLSSSTTAPELIVQQIAQMGSVFSSASLYADVLIMSRDSQVCGNTTKKIWQWTSSRLLLLMWQHGQLPVHQSAGELICLIPGRNNQHNVTLAEFNKWQNRHPEICYIKVLYKTLLKLLGAERCSRIIAKPPSELAVKAWFYNLTNSLQQTMIQL